MNLSKNKILLFFIAFVSIPITAQKYNFRNFSIKDGFPDAIVKTISQTDDGFLFFGTRSGLAKFDGKKSQNYFIEKVLPKNLIIDSHVYKKNNLLLATNFGLSIFNGETFQNFSEKDGLKNDTLFTIFKEKSRFLIGTKKGISIFANNQFLSDSKYNFFDSMEVYSFEFGEQNSLFIGTNHGLFKISEDKIDTVLPGIRINALTYSADGTLWCGTNKGAYKYQNKKVERVKEISKVAVYSILEDNKHQIWFGTNDAIMKYSRNLFTHYSTSFSFQGKICSDIFQDKEYNLWFATNHGVYLFDDGKFVLYDRANGVSTFPWTIIERSNKEIWVATDGSGVLKLVGDIFVEVKELSKIPKSTWSLLEDENNNIWIATTKGAYRLDKNKKLVHFSSKNGFTDDRVIEINEDENGILWFSTFSNGIYKYDGRNFEKIKLKKIDSSPIYGAVSGFFNETIFFSASGIERMRGNKLLSFYDEEVLDLYSYYSINVDRENEIFLLGTYERGLIFYNKHSSDAKTHLRYISSEDGLSEDAILFTQFDDNNSSLWIGTNQGLNKLDYQKFIETGEIVLKSYNKYDGFPSYECNQASSLIDSDGNFWYSSPLGIVKYNKRKEKHSNYISSPTISAVEINYKNVDLKKYGSRNENALLKYDNVEFPFYMNNVTFHFSALYFTNPLDVEFKYRLLGSNDVLSPFTKNQYVTFSSLPPGDYTFELISYTKSGTKASKSIQFKFTIQTPFWKSKLFYLIAIILILVGIYFIYRIRTSAIRKKNVELLKLYKENISYQNQLIDSEKDYKGLFENAHNTILITDPETFLIVDANNRARALYGYKRKELLNLSVKVLAVDPKSTIDFVEKVMKNKTVRDYRVTHIRKDGTEIILSINASVTNYKGKVAIESVHRDVTLEEETKKQLLMAKEAAEKSNKLKTEFLAQISHEIRTPINTVLGYTSLLWEEVKDNDNKEVVNLYEPIRRSSERIIRTIDLILNMSEISTGTFELDIKDIEISEILDFIVIDNRQKAIKKGLTLKFINKTDSALLNIDEYTFSQIFINLVDNAIKYTNEGSITVSLFKTEKETVIEVSDTGIGISEEYLPEIFDAFSQEQQGYTRKYEGNGLGLALVDNYVEINKGIISIKSKKGVGSTFRVEF